MTRPLCLEAGGGLTILPTSCLEDERYRFAIFVGASLAREIAWAFARLTFDPPPSNPDDVPAYCQPYAASGAGEDSDSSETGTQKAATPGWDRSAFRAVTNAASAYQRAPLPPRPTRPPSVPLHGPRERYDSS